MLDRKTALLACATVAVAGTMTTADVTMDGRVTAGDNYGAPKWVQTVPCSTTVSFGDNVAGAGEQGSASVGDPSTVNTGVEIAIPYSALGIPNAPFGTGNPFPAIKMMVVVSNSGGDNMSNQMLPGLVLNTTNLGYSRTVNFTSIAGDNFLTFATVSTVATAQTIDGTRISAGDSYGAASGSRLQSNSTGYGDAGHGQLVFANGFGPEGSEIDSLHIRRHDASNTLYIMVPGNLEANGNRLNFFFDTVAGGQNRVLNATGPLGGFGDDLSNNGLTFDAGFEPDYFISVNANRTQQPDGTPPANDQYRVYVDYAVMNTGAPSANVYCGNTVVPSVAGYNGGALIEGDAGAPAIRVGFDNSNLAGVVGGIVGGDFRAPHQDYAYGDEIDAIYSKIENGKLYLLVAGNIDTNFAKLNLFFDCQPGGQNRLRGDTQGALLYNGNVDIDYNGLNRMGADTLTTNDLGENVPANGVKFDNGFEADYWLSCSNGPRGLSNPFQEAYANSAVLRTTGERLDFNNRAQDYGSYDGGRKHPGNFPMDFDGPEFNAWASASHIYCNYGPRVAAQQASMGQQPLPFMIRVAIDNSNVAGVTPTDASGAAAVVSGAEIEINLNELCDGGWDGVTPIRVAGFITQTGPTLTGREYNYAGNQVIGGLPLSGGQAADLGDPRTIDFSALSGNQFVTLTTSAPTQCGPADIGTTGGVPGHDMHLDNNDFIAFISYFFAQDPIADMGVAGGVPGHDGQWNNNDFIAFISYFFAGCP
ncbi:MAG: GC-type dockerin domain-anchored protein [Phycisphaerales bacterium]